MILALTSVGNTGNTASVSSEAPFSLFCVLADVLSPGYQVLNMHNHYDELLERYAVEVYANDQYCMPLTVFSLLLDPYKNSRSSAVVEDKRDQTRGCGAT